VAYGQERRGRSRLPGLAAVVLGVVAACGSGGSPSSGPNADSTGMPATSLVFGFGSGSAAWWVSSSDLPLSPDTRVIHGLLQERACASGSSPEGRIAGPAIEYRPDAVIVIYKVREIGGNCPGNPTFPIVFELNQPLGARRLIDGGVSPQRDATIDPTIVIEPDEDCGPLVGTGDTKIACLTLIGATLGDRYAEFAEVRVSPANGDCPGDTCTELAAIAARTWIVDATTLDGVKSRWSCAYRESVATCAPSPN
jgi:hypothetical protein